MSSTKRIAGLDIIRSFAILFVIFVHAFLNLKFYDTPVSGNRFFFLYRGKKPVFHLRSAVSAADRISAVHKETGKALL